LAGREQVEQAIETLERALRDLPTVNPGVKSAIEPALARYRLVGAPAPAIEAPFWLNSPAGTTGVELKGRVTVIEFTAHWCGPCRKSYPAMIRLHEQRPPRAAQVIFATELYGSFQGRQGLTPEEEIQADRKHFVEDHGIPFKIAIEQRRPRQTGGASAGARLSTTAERYKVDGVPQIVVVDRQGTIRLILVGWDAPAEERLNKLVERLLRETSDPLNGRS
jgi:thiol-disulfide isomerase/thioredoxin